jgi:hypothetical protein
MTPSAQAFQSEQHAPLRLAEIGVPADVSLGTRIAIDGHTYRVVGLERVGAVID